MPRSCTELACAFNDLVEDEPPNHAQLVAMCQAAIAAGNKDFEVIYDGVWKVVESGESEGLAKYDESVAELAAVKVGEAVQRKEAADPATLFADAAQAAPGFGCVVREVVEVTGATLEMRELGQVVNGEEQTGLKKTVRAPSVPSTRLLTVCGRVSWRHSSASSRRRSFFPGMIAARRIGCATW